jgi:hypothetical protein
MRVLTYDVALDCILGQDALDVGLISFNVKWRIFIRFRQNKM